MRGPVVVAIDPPQGWAIWGPDGVVAAGEGKGNDARAKRLSAFKTLQALSRGCAFHAAVVEWPYGTQGQDDEGDRVQALLHNAGSAGWWECVFSMLMHDRFVGERGHGVPVWMPTSSEWRPLVGIKAPDREEAKRRAVAIGGKAFSETAHVGLLTGPRGGVLSHASEAVCIAMALWNKGRYGADDPDDAFGRWRKFGSFKPREQDHDHASDQKR